MTTDIQSPTLKPNATGVATALEISGAGSKIATAVYKKGVHKGAILQS